MSASSAALTTQDKPKKVLDHSWRSGLQPTWKHGRNSTKTLQGFMELRSKLQVAMKHRFALPDYDSLVAIAEMGCDLSLSAELRFKCHSEVARYTYPTLKQVEVTGKDGGAIEVKQPVVDSLLNLLMNNGGGLPTVLEAVIRSEVAEIVEEEHA